MFWTRKNEKDAAIITLDDVDPAYPDQYPAKQLRALFHMRRLRRADMRFHFPAVA